METVFSTTGSRTVSADAHSRNYGSNADNTFLCPSGCDNHWDFIIAMKFELMLLPLLNVKYFWAFKVKCQKQKKIIASASVRPSTARQKKQKSGQIDREEKNNYELEDKM